jgi:hypothetical protein
MTKGPHPRILQNILGVIDVVGNPQDCTKHHFAVTPAKLDIRGMLSDLCGRRQ